jgi:hypothetical protein
LGIGRKSICRPRRRKNNKIRKNNNTFFWALKKKKHFRIILPLGLKILHVELARQALSEQWIMKENGIEDILVCQSSKVVADHFSATKRHF